MPNYCHNSLLVLGEEKELKRFCEVGIQLIQDKETADFAERFDLPKTWWLLEPYYPIPDIKDQDGWLIENWGTDRDVFDTEFSVKDKEFLVSFNSAWVPPVNWLNKIQNDYPSLKFKLSYVEYGCCFCGIAYTDETGKIINLEEDLEYIGGKEDDTCYYYDGKYNDPFKDYVCWFETPGICRD